MTQRRIKKVEEIEEEEETNPLLVIKNKEYLYIPELPNNQLIFYIRTIERNGYGILFNSEEMIYNFLIIYKLQLIQQQCLTLGQYEQIKQQLNNHSFWGINQPIKEITDFSTLIKYYVATQKNNNQYLFLALILFET